jgi:ribonuclease HII
LYVCGAIFLSSNFCYYEKVEMKFIIGIDEVGRGSLAGPVTVAAVCLPANRKSQIANRQLGNLRDSKKLTPKQRAAWFEYFKSHPKINYAVARVYPRVIEKINISRAANTAALRAVGRLIKNCKLSANCCRFASGGKIKNLRVFLDGGLYLGNGGQPKFARTVIRGDEKIKAIAAASIVAKVWRDRIMARLAKKYPVYGFEKHKGYGTPSHRQAIKRFGISPVHRKTFCRSLV